MSNQAANTPLKQMRSIALPYSSSFDIAKFLCSLLVIVIHTRPLSAYSTWLDFYTVDVLARIAVPLFFGMTGYLFYGSLTFVNGKIERTTDNYRKLLRYLSKIGLIYCGWSAIYFLIRLSMWYRIGWWGTTLIKDFAISFLFQGSYYHLWYLLALLYAIPCLFALMCFIPKNKLILVAVPLWTIECMIYSYSWIVVDKIPVLSWVISCFSVWFDAIFRAIPLLVTGVLCTENKGHHVGKTVSKMWLFVFLCAVEASLLCLFSPNKSKVSYLIFTPFMAYFFLQTLLNKPVALTAEITMLLRKSSLLIYCLHPLVLYYCPAIGLESNLGQWTVTTLLTVVIAFVWVRFCGDTRKKERCVREKY